MSPLSSITHTANQDLRALYVDGRRVARRTSPDWQPGMRNSSAVLHIGAYVGVNPASGCLDDVCISSIVRYRRATYLVPTTQFRKDAHTRALWHFNESPGATVFRDVSGNDNWLTGRNDAQTAHPPGSP
jgi:hypothetical protein